MKEVKTYISFLLVSWVLVGILAFLYSPNNPSTNTVSVIENLESKSLQDDQAQEETQNQADTPDILDDSTEIQDEQIQTDETEPIDEESIQKKRIHLTTILLRKQQQLEDLIDKKNRTTGATDEIEQEIEDTQELINLLTQQIRDLSSSGN